MPSDVPPPEDPREPPEESPGESQPFRVLDARFWAAIAFLVLCLAAAVVVAVWGPKIWPKAAARPAAVPASAAPARP